LGDVSGLSAVMAARGGSPSAHIESAMYLLATAPVMFLAEDAETDPAQAVGWSGATQVPLHPGAPPAWLTAGLTVVPRARRSGTGRLLLRTVAEAVSTHGAGCLHSAVNARNRVSIALHESLGFKVIDQGPCFAGIEFDGGKGLLLAVPPGGLKT